jgi:CubicO group peptidase (beta-lactamase class C family)
MGYEWLAMRGPAMSRRSARAIQTLLVMIAVGMTIATTPALGNAATLARTSSVTGTIGKAANAATPDFAAIDTYAQHELDEMKIPGAAIGIVHGDKVVHVRAFGEATDNGRPVNPTTPFKIGSNSKSFTALAVMQLVDQGKIKLDDPVRIYLPWFRVADHKASTQITVRELLNQNSGLPTIAGLTYMYDRDDSNGALENVVRQAKDVTLASSPGRTYHYSNLNYTILGLVVQTVSGQSYERYVQDHIFKPLDMTHSYAYLPDAEAAGLATGHQFWFDRPQPGGGMVYNRASTPAGLLTASVTDMTHYLTAHLNDGRYRNAQLVSPKAVATLHHGVAKLSKHASYAMGWISGELDDIPVLGHNGETGDFHSTMVLQPDRRWGVVVLMNGANDLDPGMDRIADGIMANLLGVAPPKPIGWSGNVALMMVDVLGILILLQVLAAARSIVLLRRWASGSAAPRDRLRWTAIRLAVAGLISLVWAGFTLLVLPGLFALPWQIMTHVDMGWPIIITGTIALVWGVVAKPALAIAAILRGRTHAAPLDRTPPISAT